MECGGLLTPELKLAYRLKRDLRMAFKSAKKGGEVMSAFREMLTGAIRGVLDGHVPIRTGETAHKLAYDVHADKHADCRRAEIGLVDEELKAELEAMRKV